MQAHSITGLPASVGGHPSTAFSGTLDEVVPTALAQAYRERSGVCNRVVVVEGVSHEAGWDKVWRLWRDRGLTGLVSVRISG